MHVPATKDGTGLGAPLEASRKGEGTSPASPSSPSKAAAAAREKPQKVLPCPRCESMNTKFCYYNNYSVNQPRHFCRQCQRYWTVGGTLRNVPVGGGSRKKNRHQQRAAEPYPRTGASGPLAMAAFPLPNPHDMTMAFSFSQLPGFAPHPFVAPGPAGFPMDGQSSGMFINPLPSKPGAPQEFPLMQPMYGAMTPAPSGTTFYPDLAALQLEHHPNNPVKTEFWPGNHHLVQSGNGSQASEDAKTGNNVSTNLHHESSMLLHLGLNSAGRPPINGKPAAVWNMNQADIHTRGGHPVNGTSPPHGSSTIEEEGSTPTNGYSNSGYEEGDTVSSMWQEMHDMQDIFQ